MKLKYNIIKNTSSFNFIFNLILFSPVFYLFVKYDIILFGQDESNQIEAAYRYYYTKQFTFSGPIKEFLESNTFIFQNSWPFGYSFLIYIFLLFFNNIFLVVKLIKILLIFVNIFIWNSLSDIYFENKHKKYYYDILVVLLTLIFSTSTTDLISTIFFGLIIYFLLFSKNRFRTIVVGFICGFAFLFKFSIVFVLPSICIYYCFNNWTNKKLLFRNIFLLISSFLPFFIFIFLYNKNHGEGNFYVFKNFDFLKIKNFIYTNWITDIIFTISNAFGFDKITTLLLNSENFIFYINYILILCIIILFVKNYKKDKEITVLTSILLIVNILFLKVIQSYFFDFNYSYRPIIIYRYFWPIIPLGYLIVIKSLPNYFFSKNKIIKALFFLLIFLFILLDNNKKSIITQQIQANRSQVLNFISSKKLISDSNNNIVIAEKTQWSLFSPKGKFNVYQISGDIHDFKFDHIKKNTNIIYINDRNAYGTYNDISNPNKNLINYLEDSFKINTNITLYWKKN